MSSSSIRCWNRGFWSQQSGQELEALEQLGFVHELVCLFVCFIYCGQCFSVLITVLLSGRRAVVTPVPKTADCEEDCGL